MNTLFKKHEWLRLLFGALLVGVGILITVLAFINKNGVNTALNIILAVILFVLGGLLAIVSIFSETKIIMTSGIVYGAFLISLGVAILIIQNFVSTLLVILLAVFLITFGGLSIFKGVTLAIYRAKWYWYVGLFLLGAVGITFGILALIYKDIAVQAPLNDYLIRLREVESEIDKTVKALTPSTRSGLCRIVDVSLSYKRKFEMFTSQVGKPANDALNFAQGVIDSKGKKLYSLDPFNRKKK